MYRCVHITPKYGKVPRIQIRTQFGVEGWVTVDARDSMGTEGHSVWGDKKEQRFERVRRFERVLCGNKIRMDVSAMSVFLGASN